MKNQYFESISIGDVVQRNLCGLIMELKVTDLTDDLIICGGTKESHGGWWFDRHTGAEVDEELGWGPPPKMTGSYIVTHVGQHSMDCDQCHSYRKNFSLDSHS
jgi:hypothetical protein